MSKNLTDRILELKPKENTEDQLFMENYYKELIQHCFLFALSHTSFFDYTAFHGGTCLRIVDKINRFSEDLDFISTQPNTTSEKFTDFLNKAVDYLTNRGLPLEIKHNNLNNNVLKFWIKEDTVVKNFLSENPKYALQNGKIRIKIEIDIEPPSGSTFKDSKIKFPENFNIKIQDYSSSFSGKLHAILCREFFYKSDSYIKGRDYFDLDWYLTHQIQPNYELLKNALFKAGPYKGKDLQVTKDWLHAELKNKLKKLNWELAKDDMRNFLLNTPLEHIESILSSEPMIDKLEKNFS
ncbi:MAG: nucleotidyl transferase AbiEii/AbiGii toxin family protein [Bdellovibrionales bacterium]|nr:nucleotidyl transferase AbiEii/AbiGii toxin family protein [Bdellovibrionales bacterium]